MRKIILPSSYNYIGVFLTLRCNLNCSYCINRFGEIVEYKELSGAEWVKGLSRIQTRDDLPITLQGGEPTIHPDFYDIVEKLHYNGKHMDLLTNGLFDATEFCNKVDTFFFNRNAKYASIRFSFHDNTSPAGLVMKVYDMKKAGYNVGIWGLDCFDMRERNKWMKDACKWLGIDYREKEFLSKDIGNYKYPNAISGKERKHVLCKPSEMLISPNGNVFRCHSDLYTGRGSIGNILGEINLHDGFSACDNFGACNPCDVKIKNDRYQEWGHTSVEIKDA